MRILLTLLWAGAILAQTTVTGPIAVPTGGNYSGRLIITAPTQLTYNGTTYAGWQRDLTISNGVLNIALIPNIGATPAGTSYRAQYLPNAGPGWTEFWVVPESATPLEVWQVRVQVPPTPTMVLRPDQLPPGGAPGEVWCWNGTEWVLSTSCGGGGSSPGQVTYGWDTPLSHVVIPNPFTTEDVIVICMSAGDGLQFGTMTVDIAAPHGITIDYDFAFAGNCRISNGPSYGVTFSGSTLVSIQPEEHRLVGVKSSYCRDAAGLRLHPAVSFDYYATGGVPFTGVKNFFDFTNTGRCAVIGAN